MLPGAFCAFWGKLPQSPAATAPSKREPFAFRSDAINLPLSGEVASRSDNGEGQPLCTLYKNGEKTLAALRECP